MEQMILPYDSKEFNKIEGNYAIGKILGKGSFSEVRLGVNRYTGELVWLLFGYIINQL